VESIETRNSNRWRVFLLSAVAFTALAVLFAFQRHYSAISMGDQAKWSEAFIGAFIVWWSWAIVVGMAMSRRTLFSCQKFFPDKPTSFRQPI